jgi:hypothetical protein
VVSVEAEEAIGEAEVVAPRDSTVIATMIRREVSHPEISLKRRLSKELEGTIMREEDSDLATELEAVDNTMEVALVETDSRMTAKETSTTTIQAEVLVYSELEEVVGM